eukprot:TRINITY_DN8885_c0_g2_i1.p1 TRINITY_DN8885_c0_g2~~TRINITY_DN8885_c0_g2_i1.p1  ORF type:complete len:936 (-),score=147.56 TRINITY_DN8885_c0_g2_i1:130-2937(-)
MSRPQRGNTLLESERCVEDRAKHKEHNEASKSLHASFEWRVAASHMHELEERLTHLIRSAEARLSKQLVALGAPALTGSEDGSETGQASRTRTNSSRSAANDSQHDDDYLDGTCRSCDLEEMGVGPMPSTATIEGRLSNASTGCQEAGDESSESDELPNVRSEILHILSPSELNIRTSQRSGRSVSKYRRRSVTSGNSNKQAWGDQIGSEQADFTHRFVLTPESPGRIAFDLFSVLTVLYDSTIRPFLLAWAIEEDGATAVLSMCSRLFWTCDIVLNFMTGFYSKSGELMMGLKEISKNYVRGWFPMDFSLIMLDWLGLIFDAGFETLRFSQIGRLARTARIVRIFKVFALIKRYSKAMVSPRYKGLFQALQILAIIVWINHLLCCMWMGAARMGGDVFEQTWLDRFDGGRLGHTFAEASVEYQYTTALHWSITQMTPGSMEVFPTNPLERIINILCLIFGLFFGSTLISQLSAGLVQANMARREEHGRIEKLRDYLKANNVPQDMARIIQGQITSRLSAGKQLVEKDVHALQLLPSTLRLQLQAQVFSEFLMRHPLFMQCFGRELSSVKDLIRLNAIERATLNEGDELFCTDSPADFVYLVLDGSLMYTKEPHVPPCYVETGTWMCEAALWMHLVHLGTMAATASTVLLKMHVPGIIELLRRNSVDQQYRAQLQNWIRAFLSTAASLKSDDMHCLDIGISLSSVMFSLDRDTRVAISEIALNTCCNEVSRSMDEFRDELKENKCVLRKDGTGELLRTVFVVAMKLSRPQDQLLLAQIAKRSIDDVWVPSVVLPSMNMKVGDNPRDVLADIIEKNMKGLGATLSVGDREPDAETTKDSASQGLRTRYHRIVFHAILRDKEEFESKARRSEIQIGKTTIDTVSVPAADNGETVLYAWLSPKQLQAFQTDDTPIKVALRPKQYHSLWMAPRRCFGGL